MKIEINTNHSVGDMVFAVFNPWDMNDEGSFPVVQVKINSISIRGDIENPIVTYECCEVSGSYSTCRINESVAFFSHDSAKEYCIEHIKIRREELAEKIRIIDLALVVDQERKGKQHVRY